MRRLRADQANCTGCLTCELVCSLKQTGEFNPKRSAIRVSANGMFPGNIRFCRQCFPAPCVEVCPVGALKEEKVVIKLETEACIGCGECVLVCPFQAITVDPRDRLARKCELCGGESVCVSFCPKKVLSVEEDPV